MVVALTLAGAGFGAGLGALIGVSVPNSRLDRFRTPIRKGELLMMIDLPHARMDEIEQLVQLHHPGVDIEGTDPTIPVFPWPFAPLQRSSGPPSQPSRARSSRAVRTKNRAIG